jgi:hypothetical protein
MVVDGGASLRLTTSKLSRSTDLKKLSAADGYRLAIHGSQIRTVLAA